MSTTTIINNLFQLEVAKGNVPGVRGLKQLGERENLAAVANGSDIWRGTAAAIPIPSSSGEQMTIVSSNNNDDLSGTGIQKIHVEYLDNNGLEQVEVINLDGTNPVHTVATNIIFVNAIHSIQVGSNRAAVGDITIYKFGSPSTIYNTIPIGGNMSLAANYKVPANKTLYLSNWEASVSGSSKRASVRLRATSRDNSSDDGVVYDGSNPTFLFIDTLNLSNSVGFIEFSPFLKIPSGSIIKVTAWADSGGGSGGYVSSAFNGYLIDNS